MTSKERAELRGKANRLEPLFQVGKGGISEGLIKQTLDALEKRELIKLKVLLESCPETPRQVADKLAEETGSEVVQVVGGSMVFYKYNPELHKPEKKVVKKPAPKKNDRKGGFKSDFKGGFKGKFKVSGKGRK